VEDRLALRPREEGVGLGFDEGIGVVGREFTAERGAGDGEGQDVGEIADIVDAAAGAIMVSLLGH